MSRSRRFGIICLVLAVVFWSLSAIVVKVLSQHGIEQDVQNLYRYVAATLGLWALIAVIFGREALAALGQWKCFLLPTLLNCLYQIARVKALYYPSIFPGFMTLLLMSSVIYSVVLAFVLFREERKAILSWRYLAGTAMAVIGVAGVILMGAWKQPDFDRGVLVVLGAAFLWSGYTLSIKRAVRDVRPMIAFAVISTLTTLFFVVLTSLRSRPAQFLEINGLDQILIILSGIICISAAHSLYFRAVERLGVAVCATALLLMPVITALVSWITLGERLRPGQILMGIVLLAGVYLCIHARQPGKSEHGA